MSKENKPAAARPAKTYEQIILADKERRAAAANKRHKEASIVLNVELDADTYGMLVAASVVHKTSVEDVTAQFLAAKACDWHSDDYLLD